MELSKITNETYNEKCFLVIILGVIEAMLNKTISTDECQSILPPLLLGERYNFNKEIQIILEDLYEMDAIKILNKDKLDTNLVSLKTRVLKLLLTYDDCSNTTWLKIKS